ncbi:ABC transporter ATP-binding protein [Sporosarcina sp. P33]|uniref:ABC transporter ATP-binding protein n=1 Tax=Sporosarcina sp. P33 TaxID=1930764 RepID=UPI0009C061DD|nr:ATP-binding cassette domain-containing protein [Sporosarcina sp. P33]
MTSIQPVHQKAYIPLLEVKDFNLTFRRLGKGLRETKIEAIRNVNLTIHQGEIVAIVGASGSGKSLLANAILGILPKNAVVEGEMIYKGQALTKKRQEELRGKEISLIPQSVNALDPLMKTGKQVQDAVKGKEKREIQRAIFKEVCLSETAGGLYPFELSGGMARRVLAATAMISGAELIVADEPTPGLDPKALQETVAQLKQLADGGKSMVFITHDIEVALQIADKIAVFREGRTVEIADVTDFSGKGEKLKHPYTRALWNALPQNEFTSSFSEEKNKVPNFVPTSQNEIVQTQMLEIQNIGYHYTYGAWLFKDANLTIKPGEVVGLFGYSGSGKSTLAQIISGYKKPLHGQVLLGGKPIPPASVNPVQLVWQHPEQAINPRWRMDKMFKEAEGLDSGLLEVLGIKEEWLHRWPFELSGGELQRFCLARALASKNIRYLIADEMTTMLDAVTQAQIWHSVLMWAKAKKIGLLVVSHDHHLLNQIADRVINFSDLHQNID